MRPHSDSVPNPEMYSTTSQHAASAFGRIVSPQTVLNQLHEAGYKDRAAMKRPCINAVNKKVGLCPGSY